MPSREKKSAAAEPAAKPQPRLSLGDTIIVVPVNGRTVLNMATGKAYSKATAVTVDTRIIRLVADGDLTVKTTGEK